MNIFFKSCLRLGVKIDIIFFLSHCHISFIKCWNFLIQELKHHLIVHTHTKLVNTKTMYNYQNLH